MFQRPRARAVAAAVGAPPPPRSAENSSTAIGEPIEHDNRAASAAREDAPSGQPWSLPPNARVVHDRMSEPPSH